MSPDRLFDAVRGNLACLTVLLPLIGAALVVLLTPAGGKSLRGAVAVNALTTLALGLAACVHYQPAEIPLRVADRTAAVTPWQMVTTLGWGAEPVSDPPSKPNARRSTRPSGWDVRFNVGADGVGVIFLPIVSALVFLVLGLDLSRGVTRSAAFYVWLCVTHSSLLLTAAATDVVLFLIAIETASLLLTFGYFRLGGGARHRRGVRFVLWQRMGHLWLWAGLLGVIAFGAWAGRLGTPDQFAEARYLQSDLRYLTLDLDATGGRTYEASAYRGQMANLIVPALLLGVAIRCGLCPFHSWLTRESSEADAGTELLFRAGTVVIALAVLVRFVVPLAAPSLLTDAGEPTLLLRVAQVCVFVGAVLLALISYSQTDLRRQVGFALSSGLHIACLSILSLTGDGVLAGLWIGFAVALGGGLLYYACGLVEARYGSRDCSLVRGVGRVTPRFAGFVVLLFAVLLCLPGTVGFPGVMALASGAVFGVWLPLVCGVLCLGMIAWGVTLNLLSLIRGPFREPVNLFTLDEPEAASGSEPSPMLARPLAWGEVGYAVPALCLVLLLGCLPQHALQRMRPSISRAVGVDFHLDSARQADE